MAHWSFDDAAFTGHARGDDEHGHASAAFKEALLLPQPVLAHVIAVITGEDDDGVVREAVFVESIDHAAHLHV